MRQLLIAKFFLTLKEASEIQTEIDFGVLETEYESFACFLFKETAASKDTAVFHNILCFSRVEFTVLKTQTKLKKNVSVWIQKAIDLIDTQIDFI